MPFAAASDVRVYAPDLAEDDPEEVEKVDILLEQAEDLISIEVPDFLDRVNDGRIPVIRIVRVESEMVASVMNNPYARQSESETLGGLSRSQTFNVQIASGLLRLSDAQKALLLGVTDSAKAGRAFTIRPGTSAPRL